MAWTYSNYMESTGSQRLTTLRQHITEVTNALSARQGADGVFYDPATLGPYLDRLINLENQISASLIGGVFSTPTRRRY